MFKVDAPVFFGIADGSGRLPRALYANVPIAQQATR
jgi:hypothetical protein